MTSLTQLTRWSGGGLRNAKRSYFPGVGSWRTRTIIDMHRKRREGWLQHCPLSYDKAHCIHPLFVKCYAVPAFSIASNLHPKLMPKVQDQIPMRKVCTPHTIPYFLSSKSPFELHPGSQETSHTRHPYTEVQHCLWCNQRRAAWAAWDWYEPSTSRHDSIMAVPARSSRRHAKPFLLNHFCKGGNQACLPSMLCKSSHWGLMHSGRAARWARTQSCSRSSCLAPLIHWELISPSNQPSHFSKGSKMETSSSPRYSFFWDHERSLDPRKISYSPLALIRKQSSVPRPTTAFSLGIGSQARKGLSHLGTQHCLSSLTIGPGKPVSRRTSGSRGQASQDPILKDTDGRPTYRPMSFDLSKTPLEMDCSSATRWSLGKGGTDNR